jgi:two-component system chemotaxis sensor kinase CheA
MDISHLLETYLLESRELLEDMERALLEMDGAGPDAERINAVFRAAHTIKGSGGLFGLDGLVAFTHEAETVLDEVRRGQRAMTPALIGLLLQCRDHIGALVEASVIDPQLPEDLIKRSLGLQARLQGDAGQLKAAETERPHEETWHISLRCGRDLFRDGIDPIGLLRYLGTLGELAHVCALTDALPPFAELDPKSCHLGFEIDLKTDLDKAEIEDAFEFVRSSSLIKLLPPKSKPEEWAALINALPEDDAKLGEILVKSGAMTRAELSTALGIQGASAGAKPLGQIIEDLGAAPKAVVAAALDKQSRQEKAKSEHYVRVEAAKLDVLVNLVGELVIASTVSALRAKHCGDGALQEAISASGRFVEAVRDAALGLRMVEIGGVFNRFQRLARDLSQELGKKVELTITGGEAELDKTVVDRIGDPLTHLLRNALDHGLESPEERLAAGKPAAGKLRLHAYHESGGIVIEVSDDGRGLNRDKIIAKSIERGLIHAAEGMSDGEIYQLIFEPGFSTAEQITNVSGRGVGMDAVKRAIEELRGTVEIDSRPGLGSTIRLRLPLTLAIIDGFLVASGAARFIIPLELVEECVELPDANRQDYLDLRGEVLPFLRLRDLFHIAGAAPRRQIVVVAGYAGKKVGLLVDQLLGELQTVIKPLGDVFSPLKWVSGCTVLDVGEVGLILDVPALVAKAERKESRASLRVGI